MNWDKNLFYSQDVLLTVACHTARISFGETSNDKNDWFRTRKNVDIGRVCDINDLILTLYRKSTMQYFTPSQYGSFEVFQIRFIWLSNVHWCIGQICQSMKWNKENLDSDFY